jgi:hypothetical protein
MNKTVRMLALTGAAVAAGLSLGVAPASAAPAASASASVQADHRADDRRDDHRDDRRDDHRAWPGKQRFIGYYRTFGACTTVGKVGKFHKKWENFDCARVRRGFHRNQFALNVSYERRGWHR